MCRLFIIVLFTSINMVTSQQHTEFSSIRTTQFIPHTETNFVNNNYNTLSNSANKFTGLNTGLTSTESIANLKTSIEKNEHLSWLGIIAIALGIFAFVVVLVIIASCSFVACLKYRKKERTAGADSYEMRKTSGSEKVAPYNDSQRSYDDLESGGVANKDRMSEYDDQSMRSSENYKYRQSILP